MKEGMRPTSMALAIGAMVALAFAGCGRTLGQLIYNDSLLCGDATQACAPDGGHFDLHIVDRTTYQVANPSIPTFDMVAKPGTTTARPGRVSRRWRSTRWTWWWWGAVQVELRWRSSSLAPG